MYNYCLDHLLVFYETVKNDRVQQLNGVAGTTQPGHHGQQYEFSTEEALQTVADLYVGYRGGNIPDINFAWERQKGYFERIFKNLGVVDTLVVIGYSFPLFNRETDYLLLSMLNPTKTYLQVPSVEDFSAYSTRMKTLWPQLGDITHIDDKEEFFIPHDFGLKT